MEMLQSDEALFSQGLHTTPLEIWLSLNRTNGSEIPLEGLLTGKKLRLITQTYMLIRFYIKLYIKLLKSVFVVVSGVLQAKQLCPYSTLSNTFLGFVIYEALWLNEGLLHW